MKMLLSTKKYIHGIDRRHFIISQSGRSRDIKQDWLAWPKCLFSVTWKFFVTWLYQAWSGEHREMKTVLFKNLKCYWNSGYICESRSNMKRVITTGHVGVLFEMKRAWLTVWEAVEGNVYMHFTIDPVDKFTPLSYITSICDRSLWCGPIRL